MALFGFSKKKEESAPACGCKGGGPAQEAAESCCAGVEGVCCVKVLGAGCKSCHELYEQTRAAVSALGLDIEVEYITDLKKISAYGVMSMPALVVNERVVSMGRVLKAAEVEKLLRNFL